MAELNNYLQDGANHQARAVLAYLSCHDGIEESWEKERGFYRARTEVERWENGREQGYIISLRSKDYQKQLNIAFFEHRNSDQICAVRWEQNSMNSLTIENAKFDDIYKDKWDVSYQVSYGEIVKMADWIWEQLVEFWKATM